MKTHFGVFSFIFLFLAFTILETVADIFSVRCPKLNIKKGVSMECRDLTGDFVDCGNVVSPVGTLADYSCEKHFVSPFGDSEGGKMVCLPSGTWSRTDNYDQFACRLDCGKPTVSLLTASPVVVFGEVATREGFPWHTAIFRRPSPGEPFQFFCGGSLIYPSNKQFMVITAAHCLSATMRSKRVRPISDYRIVLGAISSDFSTNLGSDKTQVFTIKKAKIHPNYDYDRLQNDLGLILLNEEPKLTDVTLPVCFPTKEMANKDIRGTGMMSGFGVDETTKVSQVLKFARLPVTDNGECDRALGKELTSIEFCAGYARGSSVCRGDSGGGLVFMEPLSKRLYIQGITSNVDSRTLDELKYCQNYNTFTRASSFVNWVYSTADEWTCDFNCGDASSESMREQTNFSEPSFISKPGLPQTPVSAEMFTMIIYENINDRSKYTEWKMRKCSSLPSVWDNNRQFWVDIRGKCLQYFEGIYCSGRSLQLQSTKESSIFKWSFPDYDMKSVSICEDTVASGSTGDTGTASGGSSFVQGNAYETAGLLEHNLYRQKHGTPFLRPSEKLNIIAKSRADELIGKKFLEPSGSGGENLFEITGSQANSVDIVKQAVRLWYQSIDQYNWRNPKATSFSQVVWKSTKEIGIGFARSGNRAIVVAKYHLPGNVYYDGPDGDRTKYFKENVLLPR